MIPTGKRAASAHDKGRWGTPWPLYFACEYRYGRGAYDLDVCAEDWSTKCERYFTREEDGLARPWFGRVWCNPPFDAIGAWLAKGAMEIELGRIELATFLLPHRSDRKWYHEYTARPYVMKHEPIGRVYYEAPPGLEVKENRPFEACLILQMEYPLDVGALTRPSARVAKAGPPRKRERGRRVASAA